MTSAGDPGPRWIGDLLVALAGSKFLEVVGVDDASADPGRRDAELLDALTTTYDFLAMLGRANVLTTFVRLSASDQADFLRWIARTDSPDVRELRARTFVSALTEAPLTGRTSLLAPK